MEPTCLENMLKSNKKYINLFFTFLIKLYSFFYYRIAVTDWSIGWVPFAIKKGNEIIRKQNIDILYAHSQPPSSFIVGFILKKISGLPLVMDYDDPWTTSPYPKSTTWANRIYFRFNYYLEYKFLKEADLVSYCKENIREGIFRQFKDLNKGKFIFIPNGYDTDDFNREDIKPSLDRFRLVYTGKLADKFCYSPRSFLIGLKSLLEKDQRFHDRIEVILAGMISPESLDFIKHMKLQNTVRHIGYLNHKESTALLQSANALLLIMESPKGYQDSKNYRGELPAKIFEYLFVAKPVLAIITDGPERELLSLSGVDYFCGIPNNPESIQQALKDMLENYLKGKSQNNIDWNFIHSFDRRNLTAKLANCFFSLCKNNINKLSLITTIF